MTDVRSALSENVFRRLLESMREAVVVTGHDGVILFANPACETLYGYTEGELLGRHVSELNALADDEASRRATGVMRSMATSGGWRGEWLQRRKDGSTFISAIRISAVDLGARRLWFSVQEDVTEHRRMEDALRASEQRLELAAAAVDLGIWDWDLTTGQATYSPRAKRIFGYEPDEPLDLETARSHQHRRDRGRVRAQTAAALDPAIGGKQGYEFRIVRRDGAVRWVTGAGEALFEDGPDGPRAVRFIGTIQDVTERKLIEENLRASEQRLRLAIDAAQIGVWSVDPRTGRLETTPELNRLFGFPADVQPTLEEVQARYLPGEVENLRRVSRAAIERGDTHVETEFRAERADGAVRWLLIRADVTPQPEGGGRIGMGVIMDITERKEAEERMKLLAQEVDHRANNLLTVVQATVSLTRAPDVESLKAILTGRIAALAHAHQLLADARWEGADLRRLAEEELRPYQLGDGARARIAGAAVDLKPQAAQAVAIALHELATNAAKHGALSHAAGRVSLEWTGGEHDEPLVIRWAEEDGPRVSPPQRYGLGVTVVERALGGSVGGEVAFDWRPDGLVCELRLPPMARRGEG